MLLNWAVGRAQAAARAADSGVGSPRSPPPVSIQRGAGRGEAGRGGAGRDARGRLGIRRTKYRRVPAIFSGSSGARSSRKKGRPDSSRSAIGGVAILYSADPSGAGRRGRGGPGAEGRRGRERGRAAGDTRALEAGRGDSPSIHPPARAPQASGPGLATGPAGRALTREGAELPAATTS